MNSKLLSRVLLVLFVIVIVFVIFAISIDNASANGVIRLTAMGYCDDDTVVFRLTNFTGETLDGQYRVYGQSWESGRWFDGDNYFSVDTPQNGNVTVIAQVVYNGVTYSQTKSSQRNTERDDLCFPPNPPPPVIPTTTPVVPQPLPPPLVTSQNFYEDGRCNTNAPIIVYYDPLENNYPIYIASDSSFGNWTPMMFLEVDTLTQVSLEWFGQVNILRMENGDFYIQVLHDYTTPDNKWYLYHIDEWGLCGRGFSFEYF